MKPKTQQMETVKVYANSVKLSEPARRKLVDRVTHSPLGVYRLAYTMGVLPQTLYRLMEGKGVRVATLKKVEAYLYPKKQEHAEAAN